MALANHTDPMALSRMIWGDYRMWTRDFDRYMPIEYAQALSKFCECGVDDVMSLTLEPIIKKTCTQKLTAQTSWTWVIPTGMRNRTKNNGQYFCPLCLGENIPYYKKQWRLAWNVACPTHQVQLHLHCPKCSHVFSPHLIGPSGYHLHECTLCGYDLRNVPTINVDAAVVEFQEMLNTAIKTGYVPHHLPLVEYNCLELFQTVRGLATLFHAVDYISPIKKIVTTLEGDLCEFHPQNDKTFEVESVQVRLAIIKVIERLFHYTIDEIGEIFKRSNLTLSMVDNLVKRQSRSFDIMKKHCF